MAAKGHNGGRTSPDTVERDLMDIQALRYKLAGWTNLEIGQKLGYPNRMWAIRAIRRALKKYATKDADQLRNQEDFRLNEMFAAWWQAALSGDIRAAEFCLRLSESRRRLNGLDLTPAITNLNFGPNAGATLVDARRVTVQLPDSPDKILELDRALRLVESLTSAPGEAAEDQAGETASMPAR